ncbi:MAG: hypothetical protein CMF62_00090, partial [Magnetococcales bacterium]|nr:hypothetical protein [Magnetococcales bacterium]
KTHHKKTHHKKTHHKKTHHKKLRNKRSHKKHNKNMKGGLKPPPFAPPGGPYKPGSPSLDGGYYYSLAMPEFHAPNGTGKTNMEGGGIIPRDLTYLYRTAGSSVKSLYNGFMGKHNPPNLNPNPMHQPAMTKSIQLNGNVPDVNSIIKNSNTKAATF